jgi:hypothetical protein
MSNTPPKEIRISELFDSTINGSRRLALASAIRSVAESHSLGDILEALPTEADREYFMSLRPCDLFPGRAKVAAERPVVAKSGGSGGGGGFRDVTVALDAPTVVATPVPFAPANDPGKPPKAKPPAADSAGDLATAIKKIISGFAKKEQFKTGQILDALGDASARARATRVLNDLIATKVIKRHGDGRAAFYTVE